jgi:hypothetical protein
MLTLQHGQNEKLACTTQIKLDKNLDDKSSTQDMPAHAIRQEPAAVEVG